LPHPRQCFAVLRKFAVSTRPLIWKQYGGTLPKSLWSYLFSSNLDQPMSTLFTPYASFLPLIGPLDEPEDDSESSTPDNTSLDHVDVALASFVDVFAVWGHASSTWSGDAHTKSLYDSKQRAMLQTLHVTILNTAHQLVSHGCLDHVYVAITTGESHLVAQLFAGSVFNSDLSVDRVELAAIQFLLGTGCRSASLLRGSYLLQSIRTLYHIFLTTESVSNKVTARAALQQLVTHVFTKVVQQPVTDGDGSFPSPNPMICCTVILDYKPVPVTICGTVIGCCPRNLSPPWMRPRRPGPVWCPPEPCIPRWKVNVWLWN
jgi:Dimerisation and cyclophilin-binding domain of Mon2